MPDPTNGSAVAVAEPPRPQKLDDLMLAMDVVDTLRHQDQLVARELDEDAREAALVERLRALYKSQGIEVSDRIIAEGVKALKESRFTYTPPPPSLGRTLATLWVERAKWGLRIGAGVLALVVLAGGYWATVVRPANRAATEIATVLPKSLDQAYATAIAEGKVPEAKTRADQLLADGREALAKKDAAGASKAIAGLDALTGQLKQVYTLRIVSRSGEQSGIWRTPKNRPGQRNYYLIVEAIGPDGKPEAFPITSEEDQKTTTVSKWGVRVPEATFEQVRRDKADDGIIQNTTLGEKRRGKLAVDWSMPVQGGTITAW